MSWPCHLVSQWWKRLHSILWFSHWTICLLCAWWANLERQSRSGSGRAQGRGRGTRELTFRQGVTRMAQPGNANQKISDLRPLLFPYAKVFPLREYLCSIWQNLGCLPFCSFLFKMFWIKVPLTISPLDIFFKVGMVYDCFLELYLLPFFCSV